MVKRRKWGLAVYSTEKSYLKKYDIRLVIISRGRHESIVGNTLKLLPDWVDLVVPEKEKFLYSSVCDNPLTTYDGDLIKGLGQTRNFVLETFKENTIIMFDDDLKKFYSTTGELSRNIDDVGEILQTIINTSVMSQDLGVSYFGFSQVDIRMYKGTDPFTLNSWVGGVVGVNGRKYRFRDDPFKVDIDYALQCLLVDRITFLDNRFTFAQARDNKKGGSSLYRTQDSMEKSIASLRKKWGSAITIKEGRHKNNMSTKINVPRKQAIIYE